MKMQESNIVQLPLTMSPEQSEVVDNLGKVTSIRYEDAKKAAETIAISVIHAFSIGENSMIICPDTKTQVEIKNYLSEYINKNWVKALEPSEDINDAEILHFRQITDDQSLVNASTLKKKQFTCKQEYEELIQQIKFPHQKVWQYHSLKDLCYQYSPDKTDSVITSMLYFLKSEKIEFTETELNNLMKEVHLAQRLFPMDEYSTNKKNDSLFNYNLCETIEDFDKILEWCNSQLQNVVKLKKEYINYLNVHTLHTKQKYFLKVRQAEKKISELQYLESLLPEDFLTNSEKKNKISSLFISEKSAENIKDEELNLIKAEIAAEIQNLSGNSEFINTDNTVENRLFLKSCTDYIQKFKDEIEIRTHNAIMSLNSKNIQDKIILNLEDTFRKTVQSINEKQLFRSGLEINTISVVKQTEYLVRIENLFIDAISSIRAKKTNADWHGFYNKSSRLFKKVFPFLIHQPREKWVTKSKSWYMNAFIEHTLGCNLSETSVKSLGELSDEYINSVIRSAEYKRYKLIKDKQKEWSENHKDIWNDIFRRKKIKGWTWKALLEKHAEFISNYYPIIILNNDIMQNIAPGAYQHLHYFNFNNQNPEILQSFQTIHSYYAADVAKNLPMDIQIKLPSAKNSKAIRELPLSDRLPVARNISEMLMSVKPKLKFFQTKNFNIISCLDRVCSEQVEGLLSDSGMKEILSESNAKEQIIECILETDRSQILLIENGLLNENCPYILWQQYILKEFSSGGFEIISIDFRDMMQSEGNYLKSKLAQISNKQKNNAPKSPETVPVFA